MHILVDARHPVYPAELDAPPYALRRIPENTGALQKADVFPVQSDSHPCRYEYE